MKLTETKKKSIKEFITKKHSIREGIIDYIFGKVLVNKLKKRIPKSYKAILNID